ncbi:MAG: hypothetical protein DWQ31_14660 [Planctomycetota bacterium]|nr:MAG: hypothetical protein DWQ31_14660 [Planctomycetota bacterium]REJ96089.1 MAG: hypothetical protein DWQ35_05100 [Planctomycetota bacterium]REK21861.1 MAG: hypothetical protein DWQ42_18430 [Planctomycetota bacterium]REK46669.1 MAG: hypothetical protein DWQ46_06115 [Planctomycetota bacterium]
MRFLAIVLMLVVAAVVYGVLHDQVTVRISLEYFTIGHASLFATRNPTWLACLWGLVATWWVGVLLGVPLAAAARWRRWPRREPHSLVRPLLILMGCAALLAIAAGLVGHLAASRGWVYLVGPLAERVPGDRHVGFLTAVWAHTTSYLVGLVGGTTIIVAVLWGRWSAARRES